MNDQSVLYTLLGQQLPWAFALVYFQNYLKKQKWFPWLTYESTRMNHVISVLLTGLATLGVHTVHTGSFLAGGSLTITWPALAVVFAGLGHWLQQWIMTKVAYTALQSKLNPVPQQAPAAVVEVPAPKA